MDYSPCPQPVRSHQLSAVACFCPAVCFLLGAAVAAAAAALLDATAAPAPAPAVAAAGALDSAAVDTADAAGVKVAHYSAAAAWCPCQG